MASERQTGVPQSGGGEADAFSPYARRIIVGKTAGVLTYWKARYNRRVRRLARLTGAEGWDD